MKKELRNKTLKMQWALTTYEEDGAKQQDNNGPEEQPRH